MQTVAVLQMGHVYNVRDYWKIRDLGSNFLAQIILFKILA